MPEPTLPEMARVVGERCGINLQIESGEIILIPSSLRVLDGLNACRKFEDGFRESISESYLEQLWMVCRGDEVDYGLSDAGTYEASEELAYATAEQRLRAAYRVVMEEKS